MSRWKDYVNIFKRELLFTFFKDPRRAMLLIFASTIYLLLFGLLYEQGVINHIPTVVYDQSQTTMSRQLIRDIDNSQKFDVIYEAQSQEDMEYFLRTKHDVAAFMIPQSFAKDVTMGRSSQVLFIVDGSNLVMTSVSSIGALEVIKSFSDKEAIHLLERTANQVPQAAHQIINPVDVNFRLIGNPTMSYLIFFTLGLALVAFQQGVFLSTAASFLFKQQHIMPYEEKMNPILRVLVKILPYWLLSLLSISIVLLAAQHILAIYIRATSIWPLYLLIGSFSFCLIGVALFLIHFFRDEVTFTRVSVCYAVPAFILAGFTWPLSGMTQAMQWLAHISPLTYVANNFRSYYLNGYAPDLFLDCAILCAIGLIGLAFGIYFYDKRVKEHFKLQRQSCPRELNKSNVKQMT